MSEFKFGDILHNPVQNISALYLGYMLIGNTIPTGDSLWRLYGKDAIEEEVAKYPYSKIGNIEDDLLSLLLSLREHAKT